MIPQAHLHCICIDENKKPIKAVDGKCPKCDTPEEPSIPCEGCGMNRPINKETTRETGFCATCVTNKRIDGTAPKEWDKYFD